MISLGDAFHDPFAPERLTAADADRIAALQADRTWVWIDGNHDAALLGTIGGERRTEIAIGPLVFRHEPTRGACGEISGHLHPAARVRVASGTVRRRCFAADGNRVILPAYGALAGGLDVVSQAFAGLFTVAALTVHLLGEGRVHAMPARAIVGLDPGRAEISRDGRGRRPASR